MSAIAKKLGDSLYENNELALSPPIKVNWLEKHEWLLAVGVVFFCIFIAALMTLSVFWFSQYIQVNPETGLSIFLRIGLLIAISLLLFKFRLIKIRDYVWGMLFGIFWAINPAFDYWLYG